jgi:hypothetical protein
MKSFNGSLSHWYHIRQVAVSNVEGHTHIHIQRHCMKKDREAHHLSESNSTRRHKAADTSSPDPFCEVTWKKNQSYT